MISINYKFSALTPLSVHSTSEIGPASVACIDGGHSACGPCSLFYLAFQAIDPSHPLPGSACFHAREGAKNSAPPPTDRSLNAACERLQCSPAQGWNLGA